MLAAHEGLSAITLSAEFGDLAQPEETDMCCMIMSLVKKIVHGVLSKGLPREVDILNINFSLIPTSEVRVAAIRRFENKLVKR